MAHFLGIDTSNYTTSVGLYDKDHGTYKSARRILSVDEGFVGLRQSDALFQHIKNLPDMMQEAFDNNTDNIKAIGVSDKPRDIKDSYMPVFLAGVSVAKSLSSAMNLPCYTFSHQAGHIAAALYSANRLDLLGQKFIAFHVSGGTTEALLVTYDKETVFSCEIIAKSLDLKIGQAVDRIGKMLCLSFPAGKELDALSQNGNPTIKPRPVIKGFDCSISGLENQAMKLLDKGASREDVAYYCIDFLNETLKEMTKRLILEYGNLPLIFAGGVMSNTIISKSITEGFGASFAKPELSSDNAVGIAVLTSIKHEG